MCLLLLGILLVALKLLGVSPVADLSWWWVLSPFPATLVWWWLADITGYTRRKVDAQTNARRDARLNAGRRKLGLPPLDKK